MPGPLKDELNRINSIENSQGLLVNNQAVIEDTFHDHFE